LTVRAQEASREVLLGELHEILGETRSSARERETRLLAQMAERPVMPIVLFGAGRLGRWTLSLLRAHGHDVAAFIDNEPRLWGTVVDDVPVLSPADGSSRFADDGLAIVTIWRGEGGHDFLVTRGDLRKRGWRWVESFIPLFWGYRADALPYITIDLPTNVLEAKDGVLAGAELWSDERSLREYVGQVRWRLSGDFAALSPPEPNQYFAEGIVRVGADEVFVDCGAFTGDTLLDVARRVPSWRAYHAFEPDPATFAILRSVADTLPASLAERVHLHRAATADRYGTAMFNATGLGSAQLSATGEYEVECLAIDETVTESPPTFIKMDIEGAEAAALTGATRAILEGQPLLAVSAYHKQADLWELPAMVHGMRPDYDLFLRPHAAEGFDTVLYGVWLERSAGAGTLRG
jgi:FkbM family methyltransferase